jgi:hypothetical protein
MTNVLGFRVNIFPMLFNDKYRMLRPVIIFRARKIDKKWKHLPNFATVTVDTLLVIPKGNCGFHSDGIYPSIFFHII